MEEGIIGFEFTMTVFAVVALNVIVFTELDYIILIAKFTD